MAICALKCVFMSRSEYEQTKIDNDRKFEALKDKIKALQHALDCKEDHCKMVEIERERAYQRLMKQKNELEHRYEKVCKENRHLEAEIKRMKERW